MSDPGQLLSTAREADTVDPAETSVRELRHQVTKRHLLAPAGGLGFGLHLFDVGRENPEKE